MGNAPYMRMYAAVARDGRRVRGHMIFPYDARALQTMTYVRRATPLNGCLVGVASVCRLLFCGTLRV